MVLYIIGLGLGDEKDVTVRGLEAIKSSSLVFLECYTSILSIDKDRLEAFYDCEVKIADRNFVEGEADDEIILPARDQNVSLLIVGDPVCATTHTDIMIRAKEKDVKVEVIHNASVMGAVGSCGLQLYNFGQTVSIPFFEENWRPTSFYPKIKYNRLGNMHTLCLLDIKVKEPDFKAMARGKTVFLPPRFMSVNTCAEQLIEAEETLGEEVYSKDETLCIGMARLGQKDQQIVAGTLQELLSVDFGKPLHCLVICGGEVHDLEMDMVQQFMLEDSKLNKKNASA
eukprot:CAMPEP_0178957066 /NCGR_PEP_ID=MMETSP0789-20121207/10673_1 /TAXON_ID=3005 /ORGANISM="Rhizosolenia setigera, Strain CCMP 1694" /LENGTH=283 /DNA_ID=CAMNT_0020639205 /DNA_START=40 /DNA_END=891 /DNA_ORIENTATION=+